MQKQKSSKFIRMAAVLWCAFGPTVGRITRPLARTDSAWGYMTLVTKQRQPPNGLRSEEQTSELQSLMRHSYAVFCLKKKKTYTCTITMQHRRTSRNTVIP